MLVEALWCRLSSREAFYSRAWLHRFLPPSYLLSRFLPLPIQYRDPEALTGFCFRDVPRLRTAAELEMV